MSTTSGRRGLLVTRFLKCKIFKVCLTILGHCALRGQTLTYPCANLMKKVYQLFSDLVYLFNLRAKACH